MVRIAVVGDPGSGGTTVLGLLYAAQVRSSAAEGSPFRFRVAPSSMARIGGIFEQLKLGQFPVHAPSDPSGPVGFQFESPPTLAGSLRERLRVGRHPPADVLSVEWTRASISDLRARIEHGGAPTDGARQLEGADVLAVLVPAAPPGRTDPGPDPRGDETIARVVAAAPQPGRVGASPSTVFAFLFTMLDRLSEARRKELGVPTSLEDPIPAQRRDLVGSSLLHEWLPKTAASFPADRVAGRNEARRPEFFFSWVETETTPASRPRLRPSPGGGWEPSYPFEEYAALIRACTEWARGP